EPAKLCSIIYSVDADADRLNLDGLKMFCASPGEKPRWWPASAGLKSVRGLIAHYESRVASGADSITGKKSWGLAEYVMILRQLEAVLDKADTHDRRFYFALKA